MSETIKFQCHIKISSKYSDELVGQTLSFMEDSKTIDERGMVIFDCELKEEDKNKSFPISIDSEEYMIIGTGKCNAIAHRENALIHIVLLLIKVQTLRILESTKNS